MQRRTLLHSISALALLANPWFRSHANSVKALWHTAEVVPINVQEIYPAVHEGRLYVAGGIAAKLGVPYFTDACFSYDPVEDSWRDEADLPKNLHHAALVSTGERLFLFGGFNGSYSRIWHMQDTVYELKNGSWQELTTMPKRQAEGVLSTAPDGSVHLVTGQSPKGASNEDRDDHAEIHDHFRWLPEENRWQTLTPIPTARNSATGGWVGDQLIVCGGRTTKGNLDATEIYDLKTNTWRTAASLPLPQAGTASVVVDDGLIVFGGEMFTPESKVFETVWRYSLSRDSWTALPNMITPRHGIGAGRFDDKVFVIGGATKPSGNGTSNVNEYLSI